MGFSQTTEGFGAKLIRICSHVWRANVKLMSETVPKMSLYTISIIVINTINQQQLC